MGRAEDYASRDETDEKSLQPTLLKLNRKFLSVARPSG
jgi:hypothetical protein